MLKMFKEIWMSFDFKNWEYEGCKLNNPITIIWRLLMGIPITIFKYIYLLLILIGYGAYAAKMQKDNMG